MNINYALENVDLKLRTVTPEDSPLQLHRLTNPIDVVISLRGDHIPNSLLGSSSSTMFSIEIGLEKLMNNQWVDCNPNPTKGNEIRPLFKDFSVQMCVGSQKQRMIIPSNVAPQDGHFLYFQIPNNMPPHASQLRFEVVMKMNTSKEKQGYKRGQDAIFRFTFRLVKHVIHSQTQKTTITRIGQSTSFHFGIINHGKTNKAAKMYAGKKEDNGSVSPSRKSPSPSPTLSATPSPYSSPVPTSYNKSPSPHYPQTYEAQQQQQQHQYSHQQHQHHQHQQYHQHLPQNSPVWNFDQKQFLSFLQSNPNFHKQLIELAAQKNDYQDLAESLKLLSAFDNANGHHVRPESSPSPSSSVITGSSEDDDFLGNSDFLDDLEVEMIEDGHSNDFIDENDVLMLDDDFKFEDIDINDYFTQQFQTTENQQGGGFLGLLVGDQQQQHYQQQQQHQQQQQYFDMSQYYHQTHQWPQNPNNIFQQQHLHPQQVVVDRFVHNTHMATSPHVDIDDIYDTSVFFETEPLAAKTTTTKTGTDQKKSPTPSPTAAAADTRPKGRSMPGMAFNLMSVNHPDTSGSAPSDLSSFNFGNKPSVSVDKSYRDQMNVRGEKKSEDRERSLSRTIVNDAFARKKKYVQKAFTAPPSAPAPAPPPRSQVAESGFGGRGAAPENLFTFTESTSFSISAQSTTYTNTQQQQPQQLKQELLGLDDSFATPPVFKISVPTDSAPSLASGKAAQPSSVSSSSWPKNYNELYATQAEQYDEDEEAEEEEEGIEEALSKLSISSNATNDSKLISLKARALNKPNSHLRFVRKGKRKIAVFEIGDMIEFTVKPLTRTANNMEVMIQLTNFPDKLLLEFAGQSVGHQKKLFTAVDKTDGLTAHLDTKSLKQQTRRLIVVTLYLRVKPTGGSNSTERVAVVPKTILLVPKGTVPVK